MFRVNKNFRQNFSSYRRLSEISPRWFETPEGFLIVPAVIAKKTVLDYPEYDRKEFLGDAIFEQSFLDSANGCPVVYEHPEKNGVPEPVDKRNYSEHVVGVVLEPEIDREKNEVRANIKLFDADVISLVKAGVLKELSQGYTCELDFTAGEYDGEKYDAEQKNLLLNHIAIVQNGRAGKKVAIVNSKTNTLGGSGMDEKPEIIAGKPNPQNTTNQDAQEELTLESLAQKVEQLAAVVAKLVEAQTEKPESEDEKSEEKEEMTENAENPTPEKNVDEEKRENSVEKIRKIIAAEISQRERAFGLAKTLIGDKAELLLRQNASVAEFSRAVLAEAGMAKSQLLRMNAVELQAWLEAKAHAAYELRQNAAQNFSSNSGYGEYGDKLVVANDF